MKKNSQKILIFNWRDPSDPQAGGAERVTLKHAEYWASQGHHVTWVSGAFPGCKTKEIKNQITYIRSGSSKTLFLRAWYIFIFKLRKNADVIIDEVHGLPMFSPLWAGQTKVIAFIHEVAKEIWSEMFPPPISWIGRWIEAVVFPLVYKKTIFWVDCPSTQLDLVDLGILKKNIHVIPCAIDPVSSIVRQTRQKRLTLIFVARLVKMKGIEFALETFAKVVTLEPKARLWIVGTGTTEYLNNLSKLIDQYKLRKHVTFWGGVSEQKKFELISKSHVLLHTSIREGFGLTVLEANSQYTPAAVFNVAALRDLVHHSNGIIVPFAKTDVLAKEIVMLYRDKKRYQTIQKKAYTFSKQFRWSTFTKQSEALIRV